MDKYICEFEAQPENGVIVCHRNQNGKRVNDSYIKYEKYGIHPALYRLDPESLESWRAAIKIMNWE